MIKGCIFDLDGVIVDTARYHYLAWKRIAEGFGFVFTEEHNERLKGVSRMTSLDILLEVGGISLEEPEKQILAAQKNLWYLEFISRMTSSEILPGVISFISLLKSEGIKIALGTASKNAYSILNQIGLVNTFDTVVDGNRVTRSKPDPEVFLLAASELKLDTNQCVVFEDAISGVEAAINCGMKCIGIGHPEILRNTDKTIAGFEGANLSLIQF
jgi:beta-phosphoglucomutase